MSNQLATIPPDAQNIIECKPGTRTLAIPRIVPTARATERGAIGPDIVYDTIHLKKYRAGDRILFGAYYPHGDCWYIAL